MKKYLFLLAVVLCHVLTATAQHKVVLNLNGGTTKEYFVWDIQNITFAECAPITVPAKAPARDLGLSVRWAAYNFGASNEQGAGHYIAWGDTLGVITTERIEFYPVINADEDIQGTEFDIVARMWGSDWRMPTKAEIQELLDNCTMTYDAERHGIQLQSKVNDEKIFFPLAGYRLNNDVKDNGAKANYWTGTAVSGDTRSASEEDAEVLNAISLVMEKVADNITTTMQGVARYIGGMIRPVSTAFPQVAYVRGAEVSEITTTSAVVTATFSGNIDDAEFGVCYSTSKDALNPESASVVRSTEVDANGRCSFTLENLQEGTTYYYYAFATCNGETNVGDTQFFQTVSAMMVPEPVDLGLSVKWAPWNIGASEVADYGIYVGWGDPTGKMTSTESILYNNDLSDISGSKYDIATAMWKGEWRMPTEDEWAELASLERDTVVENDTVRGLRIKGKNGATLFIPYAGYQAEGEMYELHNLAYFWSSENGNKSNANSFLLKHEEHSFNMHPKAYRYTVRAVYGSVQPKVIVGNCVISGVTHTAASVVAHYSGNTEEATEFGLYYSTNQDMSAATKLPGTLTENGTITYNLSGLSPETTYYVCGYAILNGVEKCGDKESFTTEATPDDGTPKTCSVSKVEVLTVTHSTASIKVQFAEDYDYATEFGINYSLTRDGLKNSPEKDCVRTVASDGSHTFILKGLEQQKRYYYNVYVICNNNTAYSNDGTFATPEKVNRYPVAEMVDLGLSVKWAKWNMGATTEEGYGAYVPWGDPTGEATSWDDSYYPNDVTSIAGTNHDIAHQQWGEGWQIPTKEQWEELKTLPRREETRNGIKGYVVTGNGNELFIPWAGYENKKGPAKIGEASFYWSAENIDLITANYVSISTGPVFISSTSKSLRLPVRPVYYEAPVEPEETELGAAVESVDLGLSVVWASYNLGATSPTEVGDYYAWAETETREAYTAEAYSYSSQAADGDWVMNYPATEISGTEYDVARKLWAGNWRIPTAKEFEELVLLCKWEPVNGGYKVTGPSGEHIILPYTGMHMSNGLTYNDRGFYWTSTFTDIPSVAAKNMTECIRFDESEKPKELPYYVYNGLAIRPVKNKLK